ncbi:MAG TPA: hypothetical protein VG713_00585 [Pirellulales bacterium]|nr:hypothetical protein [Pirellulales bacterium]
MEFNRNHYFIAGLVLLLLGVQLRAVDSYVLNEEATRMLTASHSDGGARVSQIVPPGAMPHKVLHPPMWLGYALMSIGSVLILHALAMPKPAG